MCTGVQVRAESYIDFLDDFVQYYLKTLMHIVPIWIQNKESFFPRHNA